MKKVARKIRLLLILLKSLIFRYKKETVLGLALGFLFFGGFLIKIVFFSKETAIIGLAGNYTLETLPDEVLNRISYGLIELDEAYLPKPKAASNYLIREKGQIYIFELKRGLFWHDGAPFLSSDIYYPLEGVKIEKIGDNDVQFSLPEPFAPLLAAVSKPLFKPKSQGSTRLIGLGEYRARKIVQEAQFVSRIELLKVSDKRQGLIYKFYPTEEMLIQALKLGEVDTISGLTADFGLRNFKNLTVEEQMSESRMATVFFNTRSGVFSSKDLRRAMAYALKNEWEDPATGPISKKSWVFNSKIKSYDFDLEEAKKHWQKDGAEIKKITISFRPEFRETAEKLAIDWQKLGIEVDLEEIYYPPENFDVYLGVFSPGFDPDQYVFWHSKQDRFNYSHFAHPKVDKLLEDGRRTTDKQTRREIYWEFQRTLMEEVPALFLYYLPEYRVMRK